MLGETDRLTIASRLSPMLEERLEPIGQKDRS